MKRVLIIAPDFAPSSLPPALRVRFFAHHLPSFGWEPLILSTDPSYYESPVDPENERLLADSLSVMRTGAFPARLTRKFGVGDIGMRSLLHHWRAVSKLCRTRAPDAILIPVPPFVPMVLGRLAHLRFAIPYVVDYIDPWVSDYYYGISKDRRPPKWFWANRLSRSLEPLALRKVSHVVGVSKATTRGVTSRYSWLNDSDGTEIPYGAAVEDFDYLQQNPRKQRIFSKNDGLIHLSYVGRGGPDMVGALSVVFAAVRAGLHHHPQLFGRIRMHFVGTTYAHNPDGLDQVLPLAKEYQLEHLVTEHPGRVPYLESLQILVDSDALLLVGSESTHYTASKVFPYLLARKPILAIFHEASTVVTILQTFDIQSVTFGPHRMLQTLIPTTSALLHKLLTNANGNDLQHSTQALERHTTKAMAQRLSRVLDQSVIRTTR